MGSHFAGEYWVRDKPDTNGANLSASGTLGYFLRPGGLLKRPLCLHAKESSGFSESHPPTGSLEEGHAELPL